MSRKELCIEEAFVSTEKLIYRLIYKHLERHGGNWDDCLSQVMAGFPNYVARYREERGKLTTWIGFCTRCELLSLLRNDIKRKTKTELYAAKKEEASSHKFDLLEWAQDLGEDAAEVIRLLTFSSPAVQRAIQLRKSSPKKIEKLLREFLDGIGWSRQRVDSAFAEISRAL